MLPALTNAIRLISTLPGIGERSATRIAFHILKADPVYTEELAAALTELRSAVRFCIRCGGLAQAERCDICSDPNREDDAICVVEDPGDIYAIEKTGEFRGRYHVLMGALSPLDGIGPDDLRLQELVEHVRSAQPRELFVATNPTLEGDATANYIRDLLRNERNPPRLTRISHGIPTGASIEYADQSTLARSIRGRTDLGE